MLPVCRAELYSAIFIHTKSEESINRYCLLFISEQSCSSFMTNGLHTTLAHYLLLNIDETVLNTIESCHLNITSSGKNGTELLTDENIMTFKYVKR